MLVLPKKILIILMWFGVIVIRSSVVASEMSPKTIDKNGGDENVWTPDHVAEYFFEHKVNEKDAAANFKQRSDEIINSKLLDFNFFLNIFNIFAPFRKTTPLVYAVYGEGNSVLFKQSNAARSLLL